MPDVDVDFANRENLLSKIPHIVAGRNDRGEYKKHNTGVYLQKIPVDPRTNIATIDYETAEERGYFKLDFLNVSAYQNVRSEEHMMQLINTEPLWDLLHEKEVCDQLFHVNGYHMLLQVLNPRSILDLATVLALIRPGKKYLVDKCAKEGFAAVQDEVWSPTENGEYYFKKAHAVGYAHVIVMQLNLICEKVSHDLS